MFNTSMDRIHQWNDWDAQYNTGTNPSHVILVAPDVQPATAPIPAAAGSKARKGGKNIQLHAWFKDKEATPAWDVKLNEPFVVRLDLSDSANNFKELSKPYDLRGIYLAHHCNASGDSGDG